MLFYKAPMLIVISFWLSVNRLYDVTEIPAATRGLLSSIVKSRGNSQT
jgi:hypothetical protein